MKRLLMFLVALVSFVNVTRAQENTPTPVIAQWQFTSVWYFGILPDYEIIQPIKLVDTTGKDVTAECLSKVTFDSNNTAAVNVQQVPEGHSSGMTGYWMLKAGQTKGNASITGSYSGDTQWGQTASTAFTVFCGDPTDPSWQQNNMFGIDPIMVYANEGDVFGMPTITVNGSRNALTDFDILAVRSSNSSNVEVIQPKYNNAGVLVHGYQFKVKNTTATRIWIEIKGKGQFQGYWAKIYFNVNGYTVKKDDADSSDPNADVIVGPMTGEEDTPVPTTATYNVKIPVPNYVLAAGQTIHQTPSVIKTEKGNNGTLTVTNVSDKYTFSYSCDRPDYAYVANDGTVTALKEIKEPVYINVKATPTDAGKTAGCKETSTSYSVQIYSSESVIRLNPTQLTIPMASATEGEKRLVPSIIMKVNGVVYEPNQTNTYDLSYEGFDPSIVTLVDKNGKVQGKDNDFSMANVMYFKALKAGTTQGIVHAKGKGQNSGFWGTAPFTITVTPYVPAGGETPAEGATREISIPVPFYTMAYGNTIHQRIKVKEYASAEAKQNNTYTDVTNQYTLAYTTSDTQIATIDGNGVVTAVADNVNPAYIKVTATPIAKAPAVSPASFGVKVFGGASVISLSSRNISLAPNELVPLPEVFVIIDGVKYSTENAFNLHYEVTDPAKAVVVNNEKLRGVAVGSTTATVKIVGKGDFEGFYATAQFDIAVRVSETLDGSNTWYWAQDGARSAIYNLYPGKQLHFEFENKSIDQNDNSGWVFVASKTPGYSDQAFLAANPVQNYITWDGWGENANPQPVVTLNSGTYDRTTFENDLKNAHVDYIVSLGNDGKTMTIHATIQALDTDNITVLRTYSYDIVNKQLSYEVGVLPVYFSSVRSTIETLRLVPQQYTATVAVSGTGGSVKILVNGDEQKNDDQSYKTFVTVDEGSHVVIMAMPNGTDLEHGQTGRYYFVEWTEDKSTNITRDFYIDHNISLTATFRAEEKKWLEVTTDGQDYLLNKGNYDNDYFFKIKNDETIVPENNWSNIALFNQSLTPLYGEKNHHIELYVRGAKAFKVYAYDANGTESTYTVKMDNGEATTVKHHGTALETSQIFSINNPIAVDAEGTGFNTITLAANDNQLYPFLVQFFTKDIITQTNNRQYVTLADGVADEAIAASTLATGGTLSSVTYSNNADKEIATVVVNNEGKLVVTGHKAGNILVKLNFTGDETHSAASFDYTVIVKKRDIRLSWNKKSINIHYNSTNTQPQQLKAMAQADWSNFAVLHYKEYDLNGNIIWDKDREAPAGVNVTFVSTNPEIINYENGIPTFVRMEGSVDLIARVAEDDQFLNNSASVCINITPRDGIYYEVEKTDNVTNGMQKELSEESDNEAPVVVSFDMHVYKYNDNLKGSEGKELKDKWGEVKEYQGSDAMKKVWYIDGFSFNTQGNQNAMNEKFRSTEATDYRIRFIESMEQFGRIHPFSLPVRGAFVKFDALQNGTLTCYILQNGNFNFNHISEYDSHKENPVSGAPRIYYWFDQEGYNMNSEVKADTEQPLAIGRRDDLPELTRKLSNLAETDHRIAEIYNKFPTQWVVDRNIEKEAPNAQDVIPFDGGYTVMNKAYVRYKLDVKAGNTYYFFSNDSKLAFAGMKFKPSDDQPTETLVMTETDDWSDETHQAMRGKQYAKATLERSFTQNQWNTICLPFNVSEKQVEEVFGEGTQLLIYDGIKDVEGKNIAQFLRHVDQNILAGQPYLIYPTKENITSLSFTNVTVPSTLQVESYGNDDEVGLKFVGTLSNTKVKKNDYYVSTKDGKLYYLTANESTLKTYRAFLQQTDVAGARLVNFGYTDIESEAEGNTTTGLEQAMVDFGVSLEPENGVYNINGQRVADSTRSLNNGIYIINGQKVVMNNK